MFFPEQVEQAHFMQNRIIIFPLKISSYYIGREDITVE